MIKPQKLQPGDKVATVSLSWGGPGTFPWRYEAGKKQLQETFDLEVVEMQHTLKDADWLSHHPQARADDLMAAFFDPSIKAIISSIGGDDSIRMLPFLDLELIHDNPKIFMGYSDTTITHMACFKAGLTSFYGPSIMAGFAENTGMLPYMVESVRKTLFSTDPIGTLAPNLDGWTVEMLDWADEKNQSITRKLTPGTGWKFLQGQGIKRGHLIGGCFEILDWLRGTSFWPDLDTWQDAILFLETSEEAPSPAFVKYGLRAIAALGILPRLSGILFGRPGGQISVDTFAEYDQVLKQIISDENGLTNLPIISNFDIGHTDPMMVLPYGVQMEIDCDQQRISIPENAVVD
ncbi:MAG: LD-carboxypeptidase [Anaerolineaceae bacterium]|nr:LD-carboxypeptidase [Anaerolineaceae bacterium]